MHRWPAGRQRSRIIPARAGFTWLRLRSGMDRMWGIIPARAGFTYATAANDNVSKDHPRSRGVYFRLFTVNMILGGSSPLARGLPLLTHLRSSSRRIIPARAGFTHHHQDPPGHRRDHPRSRGVYGTMCAHCVTLNGSSPLARGLLPRDKVSGALIRIIPARAGFTTGT